MKNLLLVVGLGNPEKKYLNTYHNLGFLSADCLILKLEKYCKKYGLKQKKQKSECNALTSVFEIFGKKIIVAKPLTYMNLSGKSVLAFKSKYSLDSSQILLIADDFDLPLGTFRYREKGSAGTHNGLKSVVDAIGLNFSRIRIGIDKKRKLLKSKIETNQIEDNFDIADYVLSMFDENSKQILKKMIEQVADLIIEKFLKLPISIIEH